MTDTNPAFFRAQLRYETLEDFAEGFSQFVLPRRMFIPLEPAKLKPVGESVQFEFLLSGGRRAMAGQGVVRQVRGPEQAGDGPTGMIVEYTHLDRKSKEIVADILARKRQASDDSQPPRTFQSTDETADVEGASLDDAAGLVASSMVSEVSEVDEQADRPSGSQNFAMLSEASDQGGAGDPEAGEALDEMEATGFGLTGRSSIVEPEGTEETSGVFEEPDVSAGAAAALFDEDSDPEGELGEPVSGSEPLDADSFGRVSEADHAEDLTETREDLPDEPSVDDLAETREEEHRDDPFAGIPDSALSEPSSETAEMELEPFDEQEPADSPPDQDENLADTGEFDYADPDIEEEFDEELEGGQQVAADNGLDDPSSVTSEMELEGFEDESDTEASDTEGDKELQEFGVIDANDEDEASDTGSEADETAEDLKIAEEVTEEFEAAEDSVPEEVEQTTDQSADGATGEDVSQGGSAKQLGKTEAGLQIMAFDEEDEEEVGDFGSLDLGEDSEIDAMFDGVFGTADDEGEQGGGEAAAGGLDSIFDAGGDDEAQEAADDFFGTDESADEPDTFESDALEAEADEPEVEESAAEEVEAIEDEELEVEADETAGPPTAPPVPQADADEASAADEISEVSEVEGLVEVSENEADEEDRAAEAAEGAEEAAEVDEETSQADETPQPPPEPDYSAFKPPKDSKDLDAALDSLESDDDDTSGNLNLSLGAGASSSVVDEEDEEDSLESLVANARKNLGEEEEEDKGDLLDQVLGKDLPPPPSDDFEFDADRDFRPAGQRQQGDMPEAPDEEPAFESEAEAEGMPEPPAAAIEEDVETESDEGAGEQADGEEGREEAEEKDEQGQQEEKEEKKEKKGFFSKFFGG